MAGVESSTDPLHVRFDDFELDQANARLSRHGAPIALAPTPFELLCVLARSPGALLAKNALLDAVWGHRFVSDSVLKGAVSDIRSALGDDPRQPRYIETVPRRGYRFIASGTGSDSTSGAAPDEQPDRGEALDLGVLPNRAVDGFVGRAGELAMLQRAWRQACAGHRTMLWVAGEPGIGKTALIQRFLDGLGDVACARGSGVQSFGAGEPYHVVLEALSNLGRQDDSVAPLLRAVAPTWLLQLPWLTTSEIRETLLSELVGVHPERMLREMGEFLDRYSDRQPLLLVTEDLHWADRETVQLIDYIARRRGPARLMWLASFRLAEVVAMDHPLGAVRHALRIGALCEEIVLDAFTEHEIAAYVARSVPELAQDEAFVHALHDRTEGVPLFVASVAGDVITRAQSGIGATAALATIPVPQGLSALIDHYFARLEASQRALLGAAAVCGARFRVETLARILDRDVLAVSDDCHALSREQFWLVPQEDAGTTDGSGDHYAFRHALYREALLERTSKAAQSELHRRVARALVHERTAGVTIPASELAVHFERGREPGRALEFYAEAAEAAVQQLRPAECLDLTEHALALLSQVPDGERAAHEITLGTLRGVSAFHVFGAGNVAHEAFSRAVARLAEAPVHPMRGLLLHGFGFLLSLRAEYDEALLTAARAEALAEAEGDALLVVAAGTVQGQVHMVQGRHDASRRALERTLPVIDSLAAASETRLLGFIADPQVTARAILSLSLAHLGLMHQARAQLDSAHVRARGLGQPMAVMVALWFEALLQIRLDDAARVAEVAAQMQALVDEYSLAQGRTASRWFHGWAEARLGRPREGFALIREACQANIALGMTSGATETLGYAAEALVAAGDLDAARWELDDALALVERYGERIYLPQLRRIEAAIARHDGHAELAAAALRRAIAEARAQGAPWLELLARIDLVEHADPTAEELVALDLLARGLDEAQDTPAVARAHALLAKRRADEV